MKKIICALAAAAAAMLAAPGMCAYAKSDTSIVLSQDESTVNGSGAGVKDNIITITEGGTYEISGSLSGGQLRVEAGDGENVSLVLDGVYIYNADAAAIYIENAKLVKIELAKGSENCLQSGEETETDTSAGAKDDTADTEEQDKEAGAALYSCDDLTITGEGSLEVLGYINNGIQTKNVLKIESGNIEVKALNNGIKGKDAVEISGGNINIICGKDAVKSDDDTGEGYGIVEVAGGNVSIKSGEDAIQAETAVDISGGEFSIVSGGGSADVTFSSDHGWGRPDSGWDMNDESDVSTKGIKCGTAMTITGGSFDIDSRDDAFHSNGSISISGGTFNIASGDDGIHADTELTVGDGTIAISKSYEGLEGNRILIAGGEISIVSSDDGMNAYGGQSMGWGGGQTKSTEETQKLWISGGKISVNAGGDGLDSNGDLIIEGGIIEVDGPSDNANGALDSGSENGGSCVVNGGTIIAVGSSGMAETFDETSGQYSFRCNLSAGFSAGDEITVSDAQGNIIFTHIAAKSGSSVVFSSPELAEGETCTLTAGSSTTEITLSSISTKVGESRGWGR